MLANPERLCYSEWKLSETAFSLTCIHLQLQLHFSDWLFLLRHVAKVKLNSKVKARDCSV